MPVNQGHDDGGGDSQSRENRQDHHGIPPVKALAFIKVFKVGVSGVKLRLVTVERDLEGSLHIIFESLAI